MIIVMQKKAGAEEVARVVGIIRSRSLTNIFRRAAADGYRRRRRRADVPVQRIGQSAGRGARVIRILNDWQTISRGAARRQCDSRSRRGWRQQDAGYYRVRAIRRTRDAVYADPFYLRASHTGWDTGKAGRRKRI